MKFQSLLHIAKRPGILLLFYIFLAMTLMNFNDGESLKGIRGVILQSVEYMDEVKADFRSREQMQVDNDKLKKEIFDLNLTNQKLREVVLENTRLKRLLKLKRQSPHELIAARVIGSGNERGYSSLILNVGEADSVSRNMAVINSDGLVGKVISTSLHQSVVQILMNYDSWVDARLENSREVASITYRSSSWLDLEYVAHNIPVEPGEQVNTSGMSDIYPPGIKIGIVTDIEETDDALFKTIRVKPAVNFFAVEEVFIIRNSGSEKLSGE